MKIATIFLAFFFTFASMAGEKAFPSVPKKLMKASHKISAYSKKSSSTGHGACVSIDLSKYGLAGNRYILTAAHCVSDNGKVRDEISIDYNNEKGEKKWTGVKVLVMDEDLDVAICIADIDMPETVHLGDGNIDIGDALMTIGSPQATALSANMGFLADKGRPGEDKHAGWYQGSMTITHGNSGGPVFDPNKEDLVGIITAVVGGMGDQAPNIALFVGSVEIDIFLTKNAAKIKKLSK